MFRPFPSIGQYRSVVSNLYHRDKIQPTIDFVGTVKIHGSNAAIGYNIRKDEVWCQSRKRIITIEKDNEGFAKFVNSNLAEFKRIFADIEGSVNVYIYGEWCGRGIQ
jgi:hypothetical protein